MGSQGRLNLYCTEFINNTLSSSLPVDVGQVWVKLYVFLLVFLIFILCARGNRSHGMLEDVDMDHVSPDNQYHSKS